MGQVVEVGFAREGVRGRGQGAVRPLAQRRLGGVKLRVKVRHVIWRPDTRPARVVVVIFPRGEQTVLGSPGCHLDDTGRAEIGPGELLLARPHQLDRLARGLRQARGLHGRLAGVLAAVAGTHVGHDDAHAFGRDAERGREFRADAERALRPGPDGQLAVGPFGDGGARLHRRVGNVSDGVGRLDLFGGRRQTVSYGTLDGLARTEAAATRSRVLLQILEQLVAGRLRCGLPLRAQGGQRFLGGVLGRRRHADEGAVFHHSDAGQRFGVLCVYGDQLGLEARRPQHLAEHHAGPLDVARILMGAGHERTAVGFRRRSARDRPLVGGSGRLAVADHLHQLLALRKLAEVECRLALWPNDLAVRDAQRLALDRASFRSEVEQRLPCCGSDAA